MAAKPQLNRVQSEIIEILTGYLSENSGLRFTQALFNLAVNEFNKKSGVDGSVQARDVFHDEDEDVLQ